MPLSGVVRVATCNLNQWALDFDLNKKNIIESIAVAKLKGATYRTGPELELSGYGCEDHFLEPDTEQHCWESLVDVLVHPDTQGILYDVGMPITHQCVRYNCRVWCLNGQVIGIRPKMHMANDGNYREGRWFVPWLRSSLSSVPLNNTSTPKTVASSLYSKTIASDSINPVPNCEMSALPAGLEWFSLPDIVRAATSIAPTTTHSLYMGNCNDNSDVLNTTQIRAATQVAQTHCPIGVFIVDAIDTSLASEICEELYTATPAHLQLYLNGVDIVSNASGSHHNLRKLNLRMDLMISASKRWSGVYMYANQQGCDGGRLYFDGCASIMSKGDLLAQGSQFSLTDVEVLCADVDIASNRSTRSSVISSSTQAAAVLALPRVSVPVYLSHNVPNHIVGDERVLSGIQSRDSPITPPMKLKTLKVEEEIAFGPACWLWDYLRRSSLAGFFLPLSGGADSASTAAIVGCMCQIVCRAYKQGNRQVILDVDRIMRRSSSDDALTPQSLANRIFYTVYMGTTNSSEETQRRARVLAEQIGSYHLSQDIDNVVSASVDWFTGMTGMVPSFTGSVTENLALQNVQARVRMVQSYLSAQLLLASRGLPGSLLVLGSANVDEGLRGFLTKYDCSSADINPIGGICKLDLKQFLQWGAVHLGYTELATIAAAKATPELVPTVVDSEGNVKAQVSEEDMGMSFQEIGVMGRLRKMQVCGPVSMFYQLYALWGDNRQTDSRSKTNSLLADEEEQSELESQPKMNAAAVGKLVKTFFRYYAINRHKTTTLTPSYHAENYSPDDNRFDLRQFLYNASWKRQFRQIDELVERLTKIYN